MLRVCLLGGVQIQREESTEQVRLSCTAQALFAYLLLHRQKAHPRDAVAGLFWGDSAPDRARNCLNTAVWRLRRELQCGDAGPEAYVFSTPLGELGFNTQCNYWLDVDRFEAQAKRTLGIPLERASQENILLLEQAIGLYRGDLLEGYYYDWALQERERLRCCYQDCLFYLLRFYSGVDVSKAILYGHQILGADPLREDVHRQLMHLYLDCGQRSLAVKQYHLCQEILKAELGILPMIETRVLYEQIMEMDHPSVVDLDPPRTEIHQAIQRLHSAIDDMYQAQENLQRALGRFPGQTGENLSQ